MKLDCKDLGIRKSEFVTKTQFLCSIISVTFFALKTIAPEFKYSGFVLNICNFYENISCII